MALIESFDKKPLRTLFSLYNNLWKTLHTASQHCFGRKHSAEVSDHGIMVAAIVIFMNYLPKRSARKMVHSPFVFSIRFCHFMPYIRRELRHQMEKTSLVARAAMPRASLRQCTNTVGSALSASFFASPTYQRNQNYLT